MKNSKAINVRFDMRDNGKWIARDNGEIIGTGYGLPSMGEFLKELDKIATKPIRVKTIY